MFVGKVYAEHISGSEAQNLFYMKAASRRAYGNEVVPLGLGLGPI